MEYSYNEYLSALKTNYSHMNQHKIQAAERISKKFFDRAQKHTKPCRQNYELNRKLKQGMMNTSIRLVATLVARWEGGQLEGALRVSKDTCNILLHFFKIWLSFFIGYAKETTMPILWRIMVVKIVTGPPHSLHCIHSHYYHWWLLLLFTLSSISQPNGYSIHCSCNSY